MMTGHRTCWTVDGSVNSVAGWFDRITLKAGKPKEGRASGDGLGRGGTAHLIIASCMYTPQDPFLPLYLFLHRREPEWCVAKCGGSFVLFA